MEQINLTERKDLREQAMKHIGVLDKVKSLFLIPELDGMTMKQIADYYEVPINTIQICYKRNKNEINNDGVMRKYLSDFTNGYNLTLLDKDRYTTTFQISPDMQVTIPNAGVNIFSKRAVFRFGMLLRESAIAREVRTQLLNIMEDTTPEQQVISLELEQQLYLKYAQAAIDGNKEDLLEASKDVFNYKNRHIEALKARNDELAEQNKLLADEILRWEDRACINKAVRTIAAINNTEFAFIWTELYDELMYKHSINLKLRGKSPYIQHVKEEEWKMVAKSLAAICEKRGINFAYVIRKAKLENII